MIKYPSLINSYNVKRARKALNIIDEEFYATEKIHGSNISIEITQDTIKYFSRNKEIFLNEKGLGSKVSLASNLNDIIKIGKELNKEKVIIFCEVYGSGIQKMNYTENLNKETQLRVFDVFVNDSFTLSFEELKKHFKDYLCLVQPEIKTLKQWLETELPTTSALGGEKIEGLVYKPVKSQIFTFDKEQNITNYVGVKHKTKAFSEVKEKTQKIFTDEELTFKEDIKRYFTMNRLENVMSKEDFDCTIQNLNKIIPLYLADVKKDYFEDGNGYFDKQIFGSLGGEVVSLVKQYK